MADAEGECKLGDNQNSRETEDSEGKQSSDEMSLVASVSAIDGEIDELIKERKKTNGRISRLEELELAMKHCKRRLQSIHMNLQFGDESTEMQLMEKLVDYLLELDLLKEKRGDTERKSQAVRVITFRGHRFSPQSAAGRNPYCEVCLSTIWRFVQRYQRCDFCGFRSHEKCIESVLRYCVRMIAQNPLFKPRTKICEERGLDEQDYSCAECHHALIFGGSADCEPRLCDYNGRYYCPRCHWNDEWIIPARVIHNWDFTKHKVCRASKQLLAIIERRPLFNIADLNPQLLNYVGQLAHMNNLRRKILLMKCYFMSCGTARKQRILLYLSRRQHFVENSDWYSLVDLRDLNDMQLVPEIERIVHLFVDHITNTCLVCKGKGFVCELCSDAQVIYPFSEGVSICQQCLATYHKECFEQKSKRCPRCFRRKAREPLNLSGGDDL